MKEYDEFVSLGSSCCPSLSMRELNIKSETYPFDWVRSNNKIIYDILINGKKRFLQFNAIDESFYINEMYESLYKKKGHNNSINNYGQHFTHYTNLSIEQIQNKFNRYIERFFSLFESGKKVLFIQSHEDYIVHEKSRNRREEFYEYLMKINDIINQKYPKFDFDILNIEIQNSFEDYKNIKNVSINYDNIYANEWENYDSLVVGYRRSITQACNQYIFQRTK
jgi:hypothetical protein